MIFVVDVQDEVPESLMLDKIRIRQVLFNLIGNAVKFTKQGFIRLIVEKIEPETADAKPGLRIRVEDSGIGISKDKIKKLFQKFIQADMSTTRKFGGTGLGLSICKELV